MSLPSLTARLRTAVLGHVFLEERLYFVIPRQLAGLEAMDHPAPPAARTDRLGCDAENATEGERMHATRAPAAERPDLIAHPEPVAASHDVLSSITTARHARGARACYLPAFLRIAQA